jgi:hypothetical protein
MWKLWPSKVGGVLHLKYILTTHLPLLICALLSHVNNPQFYPIWFAQSFHLLNYILWSRGAIVSSFGHLYFGGHTIVSDLFLCILWMGQSNWPIVINKNIYTHKT